MGLWSWFTGKKNDIISILPGKRVNPNNAVSNEALKQQITAINNVVLGWISHVVKQGEFSEKTGLRHLEKTVTMGIQKIEAAQTELLAAAKQSNSPTLRGEARNLSGLYTQAVTLLQRVQRGKYPSNVWIELQSIHARISAIEKRMQASGIERVVDERLAGEKALRVYQPELLRAQKNIGTKLIYVRNHFCKEKLTQADKGQLVLMARRLRESYYQFVQVYGRLQHVPHLRSALMIEERIFKNCLTAIEERLTGFRTHTELTKTLENAIRYLSSISVQIEDASPVVIEPKKAA